MLDAFSAFSKDFVSPLFPKRGDIVTLKALFTEIPDGVLLFYDTDNGLYFSTPMEFEKKYNGSYLYRAEVSVTYDEFPFRYYFAFFIGGKSYYLSKRGVKRSVPPIEDRFSLIKDVDAPSWVEGSVCYQIFPDRFFPGDQSVGAKDGEYTYDGGEVKSYPFGSVPPSYKEGRCLDFQNGDLKGIEDKIGYLKSLGVDVVYLNPITSSMTVHRFDSTDLYSVDEKLGGDRALISLIDRLHENGIRLIVDISINHVSSNNPWFIKAENREGYEDYFVYDKSHRAKRWNGTETLVCLNYQSSRLRDEVYRGEKSALKKFLSPPFNQDGWRLDVAPEVGRYHDKQLCQEVWREVRRELKGLKSDVYLVGEDWDDSKDYLMGDMWDATMNYYGSGRILRSFLGERDRFLLSGWGQSPEREEEWSAYEAKEALMDAFNSLSGQFSYFQMNLIDSHDTPRFYLFKDIFDENRYIGALLALFFIPGMPNIFYGDEILLDGRLHEVEGIRYPMEWDQSKWNIRVKSAVVTFSKIRKIDGFEYSAYRVEALDEDAFMMMRIADGKAFIAVINKGKRRRLIVRPLYVPLDRLDILYGNGSAALVDGSIEIVLEENSSICFVLSCS